MVKKSHEHPGGKGKKTAQPNLLVVVVVVAAAKEAAARRL